MAEEYWSGLPCPPPGDLPNPRIEPRSSALQVDFLLVEPPGKPLGAGVKERKTEDEAGESIKGQNTQSLKGHVRCLQCTLSERVTTSGF